jgi:hypothetical protein
MNYQQWDIDGVISLSVRLFVCPYASNNSDGSVGLVGHSGRVGIQNTDNYCNATVADRQSSISSRS